MVSDRDAIAAAVDVAIAANPQAIEELKKGKKKPEAVKGFLRGQVMKQTERQGQPGAGRRAARDQAGRSEALNQSVRFDTTAVSGQALCVESMRGFASRRCQS